MLQVGAKGIGEEEDACGRFTIPNLCSSTKEQRKEDEVP
jgi:hypothetical protein